MKLFLYTKYVGVKGKSFQDRGIGGEGGQYMGNLFKANKVKLISFFNVGVAKGSFSNVREGGG